MVVDATASFQEVRIATGSGELVINNSRVEVLSTAASGSGSGAVTFIRVDQGSVRLEGAGRELTLGAGERGLLVAGRVPVRTPEPMRLPAALLAGGTEDPDAEREREQHQEERERGRAAPALVPIPVAVLVPVPVLPVPADSTVPSTGAGAAVAIGVARGRGVVEGVVELDGTAPPQRPAPAVCEETGDPEWVVAAGRLGNVHVQVTTAPAAPAGKPSPEPRAVVQRGCAFFPRVLDMHVGQRLELSAGDVGAHGVRVLDGATTLMSTIATQPARAATWTPNAAGLFRLQCDIHPHARGHVVVTSHPLHAVTGSDGAFRIANVPAGRHTLRAWHERGGEKTVVVNVTDGGATEVRLRYQGDPPVVTAAPPPAEPPPPLPVVTIAVPVAVDPNACKVAVTGTSPVAQACTAGGVRRARAVMKEIVYAARIRGIAALTCAACHADERSYELVPGGRERLTHVLSAFALQSYAALQASSAAAQRQARDGRRTTGRR